MQGSRPATVARELPRPDKPPEAAAGFWTGRRMARVRQFRFSKILAGRGIWGDGGREEIEYRQAASMKRTGRCHARSAKTDACCGEEMAAGRANRICSTSQALLIAVSPVSGPRIGRDTCQYVLPRCFLHAREKKGRHSAYANLIRYASFVSFAMSLLEACWRSGPHDQGVCNHGAS